MLLTPLPFTASAPGSLWSDLAFALTYSGGKKGFFVMLIITSIFYASSAATFKQKVLVFLKSAVAMTAIFGLLAFANERYTKPLLKLQRPSHTYMLKQTNHSNIIDSLYALNQEERQKFFEELIRSNPAQFKSIDPRVRAHWIDESGFSFPSGHSFNAFLFAMILSYAILHNRSFPNLRKLYVLPFAWAFMVAVSRVALGAHTAFDVSAGATLGILLGYIFLYFEHTRQWLTRK